MSQENVEIVRASWEAWERGDTEAAFASYDPEIAWDTGVGAWLEKRVYRGREEVQTFVQAWADSWQDSHWDLDEVRDAGGGQVFATMHEWGLGAGTGANVDQRRYLALTLRDGRIARVRMFGDRSGALKAVGLEQ